MKRVVLVRHAKAVQWGYEDDFNRGLTDRGEKDASRVSNYLKSIGIIPDRMISSPALRAWHTARIFAENLSYPETKIIQNHDLYPGVATAELMELIHVFPEESGCVFLFGHNPSFEFNAQGLSLDFNGDLPTSSAVVIDFGEKSWKNIKARSGSLFSHVSPRTLNF